MQLFRRRFTDESGEAPVVDGADPGSGEGALPSPENEARHAQVRTHLPRVAHWFNKLQEQGQGQCKLPATVREDYQTGTPMKDEPESEFVTGLVNNVVSDRIGHEFVKCLNLFCRL